MDGAVVEATQHDCVGHIGRTAVQPGLDVVRVGVRRRTRAARPSTPAVACCEQLPLLRAEQALCATEVDYDAVLVKQQSREPCVTGQSRKRDGMHRVSRNHDLEMRALAAGYR